MVRVCIMFCWSVTSLVFLIGQTCVVCVPGSDMFTVCELRSDMCTVCMLWSDMCTVCMLWSDMCRVCTRVRVCVPASPVVMLVSGVCGGEV